MSAAKLFKAAGGTSLLHVRLPAYVETVADFVQTCEDHVAYSQEIRDETGLTVWSAIGPYPLEPLKLAEARGWEAASEFARRCFDACVPFFEDGRAHCLGEIGRPHFKVSDVAWQNSNELLVYAMGVAKDVGVPVMLHTEHSEPAQMQEFAGMADEAGLARDRVIKHYCGPLVADEENHGVFPSIIAGRSNIRKALAKQSDRFMLETDYIDEPTRPNVVMPPDTVPKRVMGLVQNGDLPETTAWRIGKEWPEAFFGAFQSSS